MKILKIPMQQMTLSLAGLVTGEELQKMEVYNPSSYDDYQIKGKCRRYIGRALNVLNRIASVNKFEIGKVFKQAKKRANSLSWFCKS